MNDTATLTTPAPARASRFAVWLPYASLALSLAAFNAGLPVKVARDLRTHRQARAESVVRDEPVLFPMPAAALPAGFRRGVHGILGRGFFAVR